MLNIKILTLLALITTSNGIKITCIFDSQWGWVLVGYVYNCHVTSMDFSGNTTHITQVTGSHQPGFSRFDVKLVNFFSPHCTQDLRVLPTGLLNFFPNFIALQLNDCVKSDLQGDELANYPNIEWFANFQSVARRVPGNFFKPTPNLRFAAFGNNIRGVSGQLFDNLPKLEIVWFFENPCIHSWAGEPSSIPALLEELDDKCPDCEVFDISVETFACRLDRVVKNMKIKVDNTENLIINLIIRTENLEASNSVMRNNIDEIKQSNNVLKTQVDSLKLSNDELKASNENLNNKVNNLNAVTDDLKTKVENLTGENINLKGRVTTLEESNRNLIESNGNLQNEVLGLKTETQSLKNNVLTLQASNQNLQSEINNLNTRTSLFEANFEIIMQENQEMREKLGEHADVLVQLEEMIIELTTRPCSC